MTMVVGGHAGQRRLRTSGGAVALVLLLLPALGGAQPAGPSVCELLKTLPTFTLPADKVCSTLSLGNPASPLGCGAAEAFNNLLQGIKQKCRPEFTASPAATDPAGTLLPQTLPDRRVNGKMPAAFNNVDAMLKAEGSTFYWLTRLVANVQRIAPCFMPDSAIPSSSVQLPVPAGWNLLSVLNLTSADAASGAKLQVPLVSIFRPDSAGKAARAQSCRTWARKASNLVRGSASNATTLCTGDQLVIVVRGTATLPDVRLAVSYNLTSDTNYGPGAVNAGAKIAADEIWPGVQAALRQQVVRGGGAIRHVTIAGYSLGAGVAQLLSARAQSYLKTACAKEPAWQAWPGKAPVVTAVLIAAMNAGNAAFVEALNTNVNIRRISFEFDPVPQVPCAPAMLACPKNTVPTGGPGVTTFEYAVPGGQLLIKAASMPFATADAASNVPAQPWTGLSTLTGAQLCNATAGAAVAWQMHACSYSCKFSQFVSDKATSTCIIDGKTAANAAASVCIL